MIARTKPGRTFDLAAAQAMKSSLETDFADDIAPMIVLDAFSDHRPDNRFAQSLQDVPLRHLGSLMAAQDDGLLRLAMRGQPLRGSISAIRAQAAPGAVPRMSIGYRLAENDDFALEVRLQHADPKSLMRAKTLVQERVGAEVPVGLVSKVMAHAGIFPGALNNNPLTIGSSVAHVDGGAGTLGLFVQRGAEKGFLSCSHVLAKCGTAAIGDAIHHPAPGDDGMTHARIGALNLFENLQDDRSFTADAAFATFAPTQAKADGNRIPTGQGWPMEGHAFAPPVVGAVPTPNATVAKIGRSTGLTRGQVSLENVGPIDVYMPVLGRNVVLEGLIEVRWSGLDAPFSSSGDSGSLVFMNDVLAPLGILVAGGIAEIDNVKVGVSYVCPLTPILRTWGLTLS